MSPMAQDFERVKSRLDNIKVIEPLLGALRTMSMGTWQVALKQIGDIAQYEQSLDDVLVEILPFLNQARRRKNKRPSQKPAKTDAIILIIGTERGLCGKFNENLVNSALTWIDAQNFPSYKVWAFGTKMIQELSHRNIELDWQESLQTSAVPPFEDSFNTAQKWLKQYEAFAFNQFFILFNQSIRGGSYQFAALKLLPYDILDRFQSNQNFAQQWPPPIIETDPQTIYQQIIRYLIAASYHKALLGSAVAEHSSRYNLMQEAKNNAEEIIEDLKQVINTERKRKITQEIQELASGAGLLDNK